MRTRFLNNDPFNLSISSPETLTFLNLPIPQLPPPNYQQQLFSFDALPNFSPEIARLPIDSARTKFLAEVLPQKLEVDDLCFLDQPSQNAGDRRRSSYGSKEILLSEEHNENISNDKQTHKSEVIQFEAPELDDFLGNNSLPEENMKILSGVPEIENDPDSLRLELKMSYYDEVQESVYAIDNIAIECDMNKEACLSEVDNTCQENINFDDSSFPILEVNEMSLRNVSNLLMEDVQFLYFEDINAKDNLSIDEMELLSSVQYDVLEFLGDHCLSKQHLEYDLAAVDQVIVTDIISLVERKDTENCSLPLSPHVFHEFEFLDLDSSEIYDSFFSIQKFDHPGICDWMFKDNRNFKNFNELIVSCELALVDDTFKSMPIPVLFDDDKITPFYAVIEEMLAKISPVPLSLSDGIYLEWNLLEDDQCSCKVFSFYKSALEDIYPVNIDFNWESFSKGKGLLDIISSDDALSRPKMEECKESIDVSVGETFSAQLNRGAPTKLSDEKCQNSGNDEQPRKGNVVEASLLFKSMSQFNDLEFFLNPGKSTRGGKGENGVEVPPAKSTVPKEGKPHSIPNVDQHMDGEKLKEPSDFLPMKDNLNAITSEASDMETCYVPLSFASIPNELKPQQAQSCVISPLNSIIVVNIQNLDKEMIVSRRSTYQKILALEKEGLQVVERDLNLPVDIVIAPAICVVWYDCQNIRKKVTGSDEASSSLPLCIENIATDVLALLSFSFSCCILIFEGDTKFLSTVMEYSDGLYASAASLRIELQLFCSYLPELTDQIILNSISFTAKLCSRTYPKMPESETLAESFLTKFPSINPLTAHAILSSRIRLIEFFKLSKEQRILEIQQHNIPEESINLFNALSSYGEREDSKSAMTDCSSSVSSGPDSIKSKLNFSSEINPKRYMDGPENVDIHLNGLWNPAPEIQFPDNQQGPRLIKQDDSWSSKAADQILDEFGSPLDDLFGQKQKWDIPTMADSSSLSKPRNFRYSNDALAFDDIKRPRLVLNDELLYQNKNVKSGNLHQEFFGEVVDLTSCADKNFPSTADSEYLSTWLQDTEEDSTRKSKAARRLSFGQNSQPTFPTSKTLDFNSDLWPSDLQKSNNSSKHSKKLLDDLLSGQNPEKPPFKEEILHCGSTPLSKAIKSTNSQPNSPWTTEFLNRVREKSRLRQNSLLSDTPDAGLVHSGNTSKVVKTRSPSILEFFKYKGGSNPEKQRQIKKRLSSSKGKKSTSAPFVPTWTPADKRSRQILSFATNDSGGQTRLVWSDGTGHRPIKRLRNQ